MGAVVVSLIFVGLEIRQNTNQLEAAGLSTGLNAMRSVGELNEMREKAEFILRALENFNSLTSIEKAMFDSKMTPIIMDFEIARNLYEIGFLGEEEYKGFEAIMSGLLRSPGFKEYYEYIKAYSPPYLVKLLAQINEEHANERTYLDYLKFESPQ